MPEDGPEATDDNVESKKEKSQPPQKKRRLQAKDLPKPGPPTYGPATKAWARVLRGAAVGVEPETIFRSGDIGQVLMEMVDEAALKIYSRDNSPFEVGASEDVKPTSGSEGPGNNGSKPTKKKIPEWYSDWGLREKFGQEIAEEVSRRLQENAALRDREDHRP